MQAKIDKDKKLIMSMNKQGEAKMIIIKQLEEKVKKSTVSLKKKSKKMASK